jgi:hypothetical protein
MWPAFLRNIAKIYSIPVKKGNKRCDLRSCDKVCEGESWKVAGIRTVANKLALWLCSSDLNVCKLQAEELSHLLLLLFSSFTYWYKAFVLSHSQQNTWFKIFVQVQASKTGGAVFVSQLEQTGRKTQGTTRTSCAQHYVGSCTNKRLTAHFVLSLPSLTGLIGAIMTVYHRV